MNFCLNGHVLSLGFPDSSVGKRICLQFRGLQFNSWVRKICWRRDRQPTPVFLRFPCGSADKESACNVEDLGSIPVQYTPVYLAWRITWTEEPGRLQSMGLQRVGHDWVTFTFHSWGYQVVGGGGHVLFLYVLISAQQSAHTRDERELSNHCG